VVTHTFQTVHDFLEHFFLLTKACLQAVQFGFGFLKNITMITNAMIRLGLGVLILVTDVSSPRSHVGDVTIPR
jgi:hypothetical protein